MTLLMSSCYDSVDDSIKIASDPDTPILVSTAITGSVVDANDLEITNYQLTVGELTETVENERFLVQLESINKKGQTLYIKEDNQINSILHTPLIENDINLVKIQMFNPLNSSLISSSDPSLIDISSTISLKISTDMTGDVQGNIPTQDVFIDYRDLSSLHDISQLGVSGYNSRDQLRATQHLGAFELQLRGADGSTYSIEDDIEVNISIDANTETVSLFHLDTQDEKWKEVSELNEGDNNVQITATGFYTISQHSKAIYAEGDVNKDGTKVSYQLMSVGQQELHSSAEGRWITTIPADQDILLTTLTPCKDDISLFTIPGSSTDVNNIDIEVTTDNYYKLQTTVYDCNGDLEETTSIYLKDELSIKNIYTFKDKDIDAWVSVCDSEFDISTYDIDTDVKGTSIPWSLDIEDDQGFLVSCAAYQDGYSYIKIQDDKRVLPPFQTIQMLDSTILHSADNKIRFTFIGQVADKYVTEQVNVLLDKPMFGNEEYFISCENSTSGCGLTTWNVTHYEAGSEKWVRVLFAGEVWMQTFDPPKAGYFPVEGVILTKAE